jgi:DNA-binding winged helix-turn-helix (wHTH) protein/WD40 repeat protein
VTPSLRVGDWVVDPELGTVSNAEGSARLEPRSMQVLVYLAEHAGEVVSKEAIFEDVWQGAFVTDEALTNCISNLRRTLHDDARDPRFIQTIPKKGYRLIAPVDLESAEVTGAEIETSPYPGLAPFLEKDADRFFGREEEVQLLRERVGRHPLSALIGPSGVGKSSLIRAGLLASLPSTWRAVVCRPGDRTFANLARALAPEFGGDAEVTEQLLDMEAPEVARNVLRRWRSLGVEALLVVDPFEELFTLNPEDVRARYAELLEDASASGVHVLLSMRDDFLMHCQRYESLKVVFTELTPLGAPSGEALRRALVEPARARGFEFEEESLVDEMVEEVVAERGALPMLAFAASRLWDKRDRNGKQITRVAYEAIGGVSGALAQHAEATLERIGIERQEAVREIFRNLTTAKGTRASRDRKELLSLFGSQDHAEDVLKALIDARLLTAFEDRIEIVHESLLRHWPRLVRWQAQDVEGAELRDQLRQAARLWEERGRPHDLLWSGASFIEYQLWRERYPGGLTATEEAFATAMTDKATRRRRQGRMAFAAVLVVALGVAVVTSSLWQRSETARQRALAAGRRAEASKLLAVAELRRDTDPTEALAYTTASLELADSDEARLLAMRLRWQGPAAIELEPAGVMNYTPRFNPDGTRLAVTGFSKEVRVWSEEGGPPHVLPGHDRGRAVANWASETLLVTAEGRIPDRRCHVWKFPEGERLRTIDCQAQQTGRDILFSFTPETVSGHTVLRFRSWRLPDGKPRELGQLDWSAVDTEEPRRALPISRFLGNGRGFFYAIGRNLYLRALPARDGSKNPLVGRHEADVIEVRPVLGEPTQMRTRDRSGEVRIWDFSENEPTIVKTFSLPVERVPDMRGGGWVINRPSLSEERKLWSLDGWPEARPFTVNRRGTRDESLWDFHPGGGWLVMSTQGMTRLTFWPLRGHWPRILDGYTLNSPVAFSPDGLWLATRPIMDFSSWPMPRSDTIHLLPLPGNPSHEVRSLTLPATTGGNNLVFDPRGRFLFVVGSQGKVYVVPLDGSPPRRFEGLSDENMRTAAAISPSGRRVATAPCFGQGPRKLHVWDLDTNERRVFDLPEGSPSETGWEQAVIDLAFTDESTLYTAGDGGVRRWNLEMGSHEIVHEARPGYLMAMAFSPEQGTALVQERKMAVPTEGGTVQLLDLTTGEMQARPEYGEPSKVGLVFGGHLPFALDVSGEVAASGDGQGIVRVGRVSGGEPHLLVGHEGTVRFVAISPDRRWVASAGEDRTVRLWPMPDLSTPPLHTLSHDELLAKLRSMTNLRVVRDLESSEGWKVELDPFPGWKHVPRW